MALRKVAGPLRVVFPATLDTTAFEDAITPLRGLPAGAHVIFDYSAVTFAAIDIHVSALFLFNELARRRQRVTLHWGTTSSDVFKYVDRMGFFGLLDPSIRVEPSRPRPGGSLYERHRNHNAMLLEISEIDIRDHDKGAEALISLRESLETNLASFPAKRRQAIVNDIWTFSAEVIENIYNHSESPVGGVVAAQRYKSDERGPRLRLVIADGGLGIPSTIRSGRPTSTQGMTDAPIILAAFREGLSRSSVELGRGCGLRCCASIAMRHHANLRIRAGSSWAFLVTKSKKKGVTLGIYSDEAAPIAGTQITFDFYLDRMQRLK
jgi:hypothetical protein